MSGGKGGSKTTETALPDWLRAPAERNLQRAEAVQQIPYMPYYGGDVAAFTPAQNAAFDANIGAGEAFGLLAPNTLTATSGMPTPTDFDGFSGYSSQPMYESALAELQAKQPGAVAQYNALFGNATPSLVPRGGGGESRFRGSAGGNPPLIVPDRNSNYDGNVQKPESIERGNQAVLQAGGSMDDFSDIPGHTVADFQSWSGGEGMYDMGGGGGITPKPVWSGGEGEGMGDLGQQQALRSTAGQGLPWQPTITQPVKERVFEPTSHKKDARKRFTGRFGY